MLKQLRLIIKTMRPKQWIKNVFVLAAVVFDRQLTNTESLMITLLAMLLFCLASSLVYIINDLADVEADRQHPQKQHRPLASGELPGIGLSARWSSWGWSHSRRHSG